MAEADPENPLQRPMKRRDFVKTTMKVAAGGAIVASSVPIVVSISPIRRGMPRFPYVGVRILPPGPAPQGVPLIPLTVNEDGILEGIPENTKSSVKHNLDWYKYCSHEKAPGLELGFTQDNRLRYFFLPDKIAKAKAQGIDLWYKDLIDKEVRAADFKELGRGAPFRWRSEGQEQNNIITGIVMKIRPSEIKGRLPDGFVHENEDGTGFIAVCSFCAHFCCVPGYAENNSPLTKYQGGGGSFFSSGDGDGIDGHELIYCSCHDSRYDPFDIRQYTFPPDF